MHIFGTNARRPLFVRVAFVLTLLIGAWMIAHQVSHRLIGIELTVPAMLSLVMVGPFTTLDGGITAASPMAPLIAIVGCDGSGKSTLSADMCSTLSGRHDVTTAYLGLGTGDLGNRIKRWPVIGRVLEDRLARKAGQTRDKSKHIPGLPTALVVFGLSLIRLRRFRHVLSLRRRGITVITDRYPQVEIAGFYDGPGLSAARPAGPAVAWLAARERTLYQWMASFHPSLVVRLNVDAETALARKPDHKRELVARKVAVTKLLAFNGAPLVDIDARLPYATVRDKVLAAIAPAIDARATPLPTAADPYPDLARSA